MFDIPSDISTDIIQQPYKKNPKKNKESTVAWIRVMYIVALCFWAFLIYALELI